MHTKNPIALAAVLTVALAACLTVNVYFYPSEEVDRTAKQIIEDIRGTSVQENESGEPGAGAGKEGTKSQRGLFVGTAYAAGRETTVSTPAIDAIKARIKQRSGTLTPYFDAGAIGEGNDGLVAVRDASVLPMKDRAALIRIVRDENGDRMDLYKEVAKAIGVQDQDLPQVQASFAKQWREFARAGWWVQDEAGNWTKR